MITEDLTAGPAVTPVSRAEDAMHEVIQEHPDALAGDLDLRRLAQAALAETATPYVSPERPVELRVSIEDEDGVAIEQTLSLTRTQAINGTKLGYALAGAARCVLQGYYGVSDDVDGRKLSDALDAGITALGAS